MGWVMFDILQVQPSRNLQITANGLPDDVITVINIKLNQINGLVQDCSNSIANALELLQSCTEPSE